MDKSLETKEMELTGSQVLSLIRAWVSTYQQVSTDPSVQRMSVGLLGFVSKLEANDEANHRCIE